MCWTGPAIGTLIIPVFILPYSSVSVVCLCMPLLLWKKGMAWNIFIPTPFQWWYSIAFVSGFWLGTFGKVTLSSTGRWFHSDTRWTKTFRHSFRVEPIVCACGPRWVVCLRCVLTVFSDILCLIPMWCMIPWPSHCMCTFLYEWVEQFLCPIPWH